jgi:erythromycin esterase
MSLSLRALMLSLAGFALYAVSTLAQAAQSSPPTPTAETLRPHTIPIRTIDPKDDDFSDLKPLISKIADARIVVLGEATHSEGTTSQAKARLVRFLHREMGFDVLAWESGFVQTYGLNIALRNQGVPLEQAKAYLMSGGWASEEGIHPVFEYARASWQTSRPLEMAAFDCGRPRMAAPFFKEYLTNLSQRAPALALSAEGWALVESLMKRGYGFISNEKPKEDERDRERAVLQGLLERMRSQRSELSKAISERDWTLAERFVWDALMSEQINYTMKTEGPREWNYARDRYMADTFRWLLDQLYPNRKIIVWVATAHFIRNSNLIENQEDKTGYAVPWMMGNHLYPLWGEKLYTIAFTAYGGKLGDVFPEEWGVPSQVSNAKPAPAESFEAAAHALNQPYLFVDLRQPPKDHWLRNKFLSLSLGRLENVAPWSKIVDAFFFIDQAEPIRYLPRAK